MERGRGQSAHCLNFVKSFGRTIFVGFILARPKKNSWQHHFQLPSSATARSHHGTASFLKTLSRYESSFTRQLRRKTSVTRRESQNFSEPSQTRTRVRCSPRERIGTTAVTLQRTNIRNCVTSLNKLVTIRSEILLDRTRAHYIYYNNT